ncbi:hypothetical protein DDZ15_04060 [Rhodohalobacter mucosus]|uniref:Uncharacterized protein n=1 Tax=Rhodohalobacter mucosus TaxID=2079485 RepID=A0A316U2I2_9BACT|nr:hypothetical protein DDZ15_04060 [Rhodohalobacter mucosus]
MVEKPRITLRRLQAKFLISGRLYRIRGTVLRAEGDFRELNCTRQGAGGRMSGTDEQKKNAE